MTSALLVAYKALADLAAKASLFLITIFAARQLSQYDFGVFSVASALGWVLTVAADFGIQLHLARTVALRPDAAERLLGRWLRVRLCTAVASIIVVGAGLAAGGWRAGDALPIVVLVAVYACSGLIEFLHYFYRGLARTDVESSLTIWHRLATLGCAAAVLVWRPDLTGLGLAMLLPALTTLAVSLRIATRIGRARVDDVERDAPVKAAGLEFRREILPIGLGIVLSALYFRIDIFLVEMWCGTSLVALYNAVFRLVEALRLFPAAVLAVTLPTLVRARDRRPLTRVSLAVTLFAAATTIVLWPMAPWLVPFVYGADYTAAVSAFRILTLSFPLLSLNYALTHQLIGWEGERAYAAICGGALIVNLALNARLIPALSIDGAAWATLGTEAFLTAGCITALRLIAGRRATLMHASVVSGFSRTAGPPKGGHYRDFTGS